LMAMIAEQVAAPTAHMAAKDLRIRRACLSAAIQEIGAQANKTSHG